MVMKGIQRWLQTFCEFNVTNYARVFNFNWHNINPKVHANVEHMYRAKSREPSCPTFLSFLFLEQKKLLYKSKEK